MPPGTKLCEQDVRDIRRLVCAGEDVCVLAERYEVTPQTINNIAGYRTYPDVPDDPGRAFILSHRRLEILTQRAKLCVELLQLAQRDLELRVSRNHEIWPMLEIAIDACIDLRGAFKQLKPEPGHDIEDGPMRSSAKDD